MNTMRKLEFPIGDRVCTVYSMTEPVYLLIQPVDEHDYALLDREAEYIRQHTSVPFALASFRVQDWNTELSPWAAPAVFGGADFGAGAAATLDYVRQTLLPTLKAQYDTVEKTVLGGYSLAGLFALWCSYQTAAFDGIAAASPSVWFDGWLEYARRNPMRAQTVYLSLGDREEKARNTRMARVGECIRTQYALLEEASVRCALEWNPGNHFKDTDIRTAKGFVWAMEHLNMGVS